MTIPPTSYHMWCGSRGWFGRTEFHHFPDVVQHDIVGCRSCTISDFTWAVLSILHTEIGLAGESRGTRALLSAFITKSYTELFLNLFLFKFSMFSIQCIRH